MSGERWVSKCGTIELRCGDWREVLADVERCDCVCTDPPYSAGTHDKQRHGRRPEQCNGRYVSARGIDYAPIDDAGIDELVARWPFAAWQCIFTDSILAETIRHKMSGIGRTAFAPIACVQIGMNVRLAGDGPSNWTVYLVVSRTKQNCRWGTLPGAYVGNPFEPGQNTATATRRSSVVGSKPLWLMRSLIRDYSRPGDLVVDPFAGGATTLLACAIEGRRCIGAELDPETYAKAVKRLSAGWTVDFTARLAKPKQGDLGL